MRILLATTIALLVVGCGGAATPSATPDPTASPALATPSPVTPAPTPEAYQVKGIVSVPGFTTARGCKANAGYDDLATGGNVVLKDESERTIGAGALELWDGPDSAYQSLQAQNTVGDYPCLFRYEISVPRAAFYHISVGRRDGPTESFDGLAAQGWQWDLALGG